VGDRFFLSEWNNRCRMNFGYGTREKIFSDSVNVDQRSRVDSGNTP
jgi:hypothetical protein